MTAAQIVEAAKVLARSVETWADLSNALFNPVNGIVATAYQNRADRTAFRQTAEYRAIRQILNDTIDRTGLIEGATPKKVKVLLDATPNSHQNPTVL
jgi:hypothetical protein